MKIYIAGPISGKGGDDVFGNFESRKRQLEEVGYTVFSPLTGKGEIRNELEYRAHGYDHPLASNHAIVQRDFWMVDSVDIVYIDLMDAERVSIGSMMELAWAHATHTYCVVAMPEEGPHMHAFVLECASVVYHSREEAMTYLKELIWSIS